MDLTEIQFEPVMEDFFKLSESDIERYGKADFVWLDAGSVADDARFLSSLFRHVNEGGIIAMHEPYCAASVQEGSRTRMAMVRNPLWEQIARRPAADVDILSVPEMHKYRQGGIGILRKRYKWEADRHQRFERELIELGMAPIRLDVPGLIVPSDHRHPNPMTDVQIRKVYYAVGCGAQTIKEIVAISGGSEQSVELALNALLESGGVILNQGLYEENPSAWERQGGRV